MMNSAIGKTVAFRVRHSGRVSGGKGYFVRFDATAVISSTDDFQVHFDPIPPNEPSADFEAAMREIVEGFRQALSTSGLGARISVTNLSRHEIDFDASKFGDRAKLHLSQALESLQKTQD